MAHDSKVGGWTMYSLETQVKRSYTREVAMLEQLRDCLEMERESLIQVDVDQLWELMEKKNTLVMDIERAAKEVKILMDQYFVGSSESPRSNALKEWPWFGVLSRKTSILKEDVRVRLKDNMAFIQDTLGFFDELVGILIKGGAEARGYEHLINSRGTNQPRIYHREV